MKLVQSAKPVKTEHTKHGKLEVHVETPQIESLTDAVEFFKGEENLVEYLNGAIDTSAKNGARAYLRLLPENADAEEGKMKAKQISRDYSPGSTGVRGTSVKAKAQKLDQIAELVKSGKTFSQDELMAMLGGIS